MSSAEDVAQWDFEPIKKWVEEASTTTGDVKWDALKKWLDKCETKFSELKSALEEAEDEGRGEPEGWTSWKTICSNTTR
jgi:hypothetical protein